MTVFSFIRDGQTCIPVGQISLTIGTQFDHEEELIFSVNLAIFSKKQTRAFVT